MVEFFSAGFFSLTNPTLTVGLWGGLLAILFMWALGSAMFIADSKTKALGSGRSRAWMLSKIELALVGGFFIFLWWAIFIVALDTWVRRVRRYLSEPVGGKKRPPQVS
jgi:hypothetical protein